MLPPKPWRADALARLLLGGVLCLCASLLVVAGFHFNGPDNLRPAIPILLFVAAAYLVVALVLINQPWRVETMALQMVGALVCLFASALITSWALPLDGSLPENLSGEHMLLAEIAGVFLFHAFLREHRMTWAEAFGLEHRRAQALLFGLAAACVLLPLCMALQVASKEGMAWLGFHPQEQQAVRALRVTSTWLDRASLGVLAIAVAPVVEEILFRGILYPAVKRIGYPRLALWFVAVLFAAVHCNVATFVPLLALAAVLTFVYEASGNLLATILAHMLFNAANFIEFYWQQWRTGPF